VGFFKGGGGVLCMKSINDFLFYIAFYLSFLNEIGIYVLFFHNCEMGTGGQSLSPVLFSVGLVT
jgi:hypothetical protein